LASMEKALDILLLFNSDRQEMSATDISEAMGIPLSTTYKYLKALREKDFINKDNCSNHFHLGWTIFQIVNHHTDGRRISDIAYSEMRSLAANIGETILLTVISGQKALCLEKVDSSHLVKISHDRGSVRPLHSGASGKILLAFQASDFISAYCDRDFSLSSDQESTIYQQLELIRRQGFAFSDSELDSGAVAVAAPVFNHTSRLVAGLTVAGPKDRMNKNKLGTWTQLVREKARIMSRSLGCPDNVLYPDSHALGAVLTKA
jgi:DNA-binding IclR family transcriptional regulator